MKKTIICILLITSLLMSTLSISVFSAKTDEAAVSDDSSDIVSVSAGVDMSAVVRKDGTLWTWGCNELAANGATWGNYWSFDLKNQCLGLAAGQHVDSTPMIAFSENTQSVVCGLQFTDSDAYSRYSIPITSVLDSNNSLWMWGGFRYGVLGNEKDYNGYEWKPYKVLDDVISYDTSGHHSAAVTSDGSLYMWGYNYYGQLGNETTDNLCVPTKIMDDVVSVSLGACFSAAIKTDGSLWTWGQNDYGQLGNNTTEHSYVPVKVMDNVTSVSLGNDHCLVIARNGSLYVWGHNNYGQLGLGNNTDMLVPTLNEDFDNDIEAVAAGGNFSAAVLDSGDLYMWGDNNHGQLGNKSTTSRSRSTRIMRNVQQISLGQYHTLAVKNDGTLWAWGNNQYGQLGDRTSESKTQPVEIHLGRINVSFSGDGTQEKIIDAPWEDTFLYDKSTSYNQDMAICGLLLSESAYHNASAVFGQFGYAYADQEYNGEYPSFYVGYRVLWDYDSPHIHIILGIRGTTTNDDKINDVRSCVDNFESNGTHFINVISLAEQKIISKLKKDNINISLTRKNTKFFLTGHSLGGACAGKTGLMMVDNGMALANNMYVYTYASPRFNNNSDWNDAVPRMFNIINSCDDVVPNYPQFDFTSNRAGTDIFYFTDDGGKDFNDKLYELYDENVPDDWNEFTFVNGRWGAHMTPVYLAMLLCSDPDDSFEHDYFSIFNRVRMIRVHCPVDVEVYDAEGYLCAYTSGEEIHYSKNSPVALAIDGDEKIIGIPGYREYDVRYIGTDTGTMKIEDQIYSIQTGELDLEKTFYNLTLDDGKLFGSIIDGSENSDQTQLYVVDEEGDNLKSVDQNGNETELAKYDLTENEIEFSLSDYLYSGKQIKPDVRILNNDLTEDKDYRIVYKNNTHTGTASVTVKGINDYRGRYTKTYTIFGSGDADFNGNINSIDVTWIQRHLSQIETPYTAEQLTNGGDVDGSGELELTDASFIQYYLANMKTPYMIGKTESSP